MAPVGFSAAALLGVLETHTPIAATGFVVALSGGEDSASLLAALIQQGPRLLRDLPVRAVHVDHGLSPAAPDFRRACQEQCRRLAVPLTLVAVSVDSGRGVSVEAAARDARYAVLAQDLKVGECLLTAHHADDQAETLLLQLLRGAGLKGMAAMPVCRPWAGGWHLRPLLQFAKRDLHLFGVGAGVTAVPDPMNDDTRFDRAYMRRHLWPIIEARWPGAAIAVSRTAGHVAEAQSLLDRAAAQAVDLLRDGDALSVAGLRALTSPQQVNTLRYWIATHAAPPPSAARLIEAIRQIVAADSDHQPAVIWGGHALRRYRNRLFLTPASPPVLKKHCEWRVTHNSNLDLGGELGVLQWSPQRGGLDAARLPDTLTVRPRHGGETLKVHRRGRTQTLQHLCQTHGVLPWMRDALPLVYAGRDLIAVGDLWQDARWCVGAREPGFGCAWRGAPILV
jgi:tRNA(Ile)-lysidine synthase